MNKEIHEIIKKHHLHPIAYKKIGKVYIITDVNRSYVLKFNTSNYDIYKYLESRDFLNIPENYNNKNDHYDLSEYIEDIKTSKEQKVNDLIKLLAFLHFKTSYIKEIDLDEIKDIYENNIKRINEVKDYYVRLNDLLDKEIFLSPALYLLARNISLIYALLNYSHEILNNWYNSIKTKTNVRVALLHHNINIDHLIINDNKYLINWDKAYFGMVENDILEFFRKYYAYLDLDETLKLYELINKLEPEEKELLLAELAIPKIIELSNNTFLDTKRINQEINYLIKIHNSINKKTFNKEKNDM